MRILLISILLIGPMIFPANIAFANLAVADLAKNFEREAEDVLAAVRRYIEFDHVGAPIILAFDKLEDESDDFSDDICIFHSNREWIWAEFEDIQQAYLRAIELVNQVETIPRTLGRELRELEVAFEELEEYINTIDAQLL